MAGPAPVSLGATRAYDEIRAAIVEQRYQPGERLVEQRVAAEFGLSRTPVREALRQLASEGLVVIEPNRGAVVREMTESEIVDLYDLRARLESFAAELAADRMSAGAMQRLQVAVDAFSAEAARFDPDNIDSVRRLNAHNRTIHDAIVEGAGHQRLAAMLARTVDVPLVFQAFRSFSRSDVQRSDLFHRLIAAAISAREPLRAGRLMHEHIRQGLDLLTAAHVSPPDAKPTSVAPGR